jgi:UDP-N-acetyl-D-glucosamine dehydrogenase
MHEPSLFPAGATGAPAAFDPHTRARVGVVGLGYVGLPLAVGFAEAGHEVVGVDVNAVHVNRLLARESPIEDVSSDRLAAVLGHMLITTRMARLARVDAIVLCVPTPLTPNREPDLSALVAAAKAVSEILQPGHLVVVESTTYPGTTRERVGPVLEESGLRAGEDFHLAFSPERVDPGRHDFDLRTTPKVVGGLTPACLDKALELYGSVCDSLVPVSTPEAAEMTKILENVFRSVNIALVNELSMLCDRMAIDVWEVVDAAATKPFGFMRFDPGPGMGGHCLPIDPFYLAWKAREYDFCTEFIELAGKVNQRMPDWCVERVERALNDAGKPVRGARVLVLGVSYKAGVGDVRESPALKILQRLRDHGADVEYHDPYVDTIPATGLSSVSLDEALARADAAVIVTAHPGIDYASLAERTTLVDLRGVMRKGRAAVPVVALEPRT